MASVKFFRERPVKRMRKVIDGIRLIFYSPVTGQPGKTQTVSQADWDQFGTTKFLPDEQATGEKLRELAAKSP